MATKIRDRQSATFTMVQTMDDALAYLTHIPERDSIMLYGKEDRRHIHRNGTVDTFPLSEEERQTVRYENHHRRDSCQAWDEGDTECPCFFCLTQRNYFNPALPMICLEADEGECDCDRCKMHGHHIPFQTVYVVVCKGCPEMVCIDYSKALEHAKERDGAVVRALLDRDYSRNPVPFLE